MLKAVRKHKKYHAMSKNSTLNIRITDEDKQAILSLCNQRSVTVSTLVRDHLKSIDTSVPNSKKNNRTELPAFSTKH